MRAIRVGLLGVLAAVCLFVTPVTGEILSGFVHGELELEFWGPWPDAIEIDFEVGVEYAVGPWTFGVLVDIEQDGLEDLAFLSTTTFGPFKAYSLYWLAGWFGDEPLPGIDLLAEWDNAIWMNLAGVEAWTFFAIRETDQWFLGSLSGAGLSMGGHSAAGAVEVWVEISFGLDEMLPFIYWNGLEYTIGKNLACDLIGVIDPTCELDFTFAQAYVDFPFCCTDATAWIGFDRDGFYAVELWVLDVPIGGTAVSLEWVDLWFEIDYKEFGLWFALDIGESVCIEPFITLETDGPAVIEGLEVDALELVCSFGDVTVTISELFSDDDYYMGIDGAIYRDEQLFGWVIPAVCVDWMPEAEQAIAIEVRREGCCGGDSFFGLYNFFDADLNGVMFDWLGLRARAVAPVTPAFSMYIETWIWFDGIENVLLGFDYTWGTLRAVTSDWTCCWWGI
jgi:hypothetical protein